MRHDPETGLVFILAFSVTALVAFLVTVGAVWWVV
jgi:hypothetical protein